MTTHSIFHQLTNVLSVSILNSKVFSRGLVTEVPFVWNRGHRVWLVGVLCNCRRGAWEFQQGQHHLGGITLLPWEVRRLEHSQAKARSCLNYRSNLADLRICGLTFGTGQQELCKGLWVVVTCAPMGHRALRPGVPEWAMGHKPSCQPTNPGKALELSWSQFYLLLCICEEIELGKPAWGWNISRKQSQSVPAWWRVLRSCIWGSVWLCRWKRTGFRARRWALASWKPADHSTALTSTSTFIYRTALSMGLPGDSDGKWDPVRELLYKCWCAIQGTQQNASSEGKGWELNSLYHRFLIMRCEEACKRQGKGSRWGWLILLVFRKNFLGSFKSLGPNALT